jgi:hypothetical protein
MTSGDGGGGGGRCDLGVSHVTAADRGRDQGLSSRILGGGVEGGGGGE